ncbi:MAG: inorganic phosphate transporter [Mycobacteriaceae bacterium]|nr:inorganic phosphate transporter [Mycobacteriaceae bacterium]
MTAEALVLAIVVVTALAFDFTNGFHDTANAMSTSIATGALRPKVAVAMSAVLNLAGAFLSVEVAATVAKGIVNLNGVDPDKLLIIVFAGLVGGILWNLLTWLFGIPSSSSHALFGGLIGAAVAALGFGGVSWSSGVFAKIIVPAALAPPVAALVSAIGTRLIYGITRPVPEVSKERGFRWGQAGSAGLVSLAHGTNDAQKTMGVIMLALIAHGTVGKDDPMPFWVKLSCALAIALGTYVGGWRIIRTLGKGVVEIASPQGLAAESASAAIILTSSQFGLPLSTTHTATGAIMGTGLGRGNGVRWNVVGRMVLTWVITLPLAGLGGAACWAVAHFVGGIAGVLIVVGILVAASAAIWVRSRRKPVNSANVNADWDDTAALSDVGEPEITVVDVMAEPDPPLPPADAVRTKEML